MFNITFQQIATFLEVAKRLNISAVAEDMYISQAALSKMIQRMEDSLGMKLFKRSNRGLSLTPEGEFLYSRLRRPFTSINNALLEAKNIGADSKLTVRIGYPSTFDVNNDYDKLKQFIDAYEKCHPNVDFIESIFDFIDLKHAISYGEVDVAFLHSFVMEEMSGISSRPILNCRTFLALSDKHPLAKYNVFTPEMLCDQTIYSMHLFDKGDNDSTLMKLFGFDIQPGRREFAPNFATLLRMIKSGKGVSLAGFFLDPAKNGVKFLPFHENVVTHTLDIAWRTDDSPKAVLEFVESFPKDPAELTYFYNPDSE